jgi:hypothetical protein
VTLILWTGLALFFIGAAVALSKHRLRTAHVLWLVAELAFVVVVIWPTDSLPEFVTACVGMVVVLGSAWGTDKVKREQQSRVNAA